MIKLSEDFDLGLDRARIQNRNDSDRQTATAKAILARFFGRVPSTRIDLQLLADEVGMGKTYVALAVAYSVLSHLKSGDVDADLEGCYRKVLILTPRNHVLFKKWQREVDEFVGRCVRPDFRDEAAVWFRPTACSHFDELVAELRRAGGGASVVIATTGVFGRPADHDLKRRLLLGSLFRFWGNRIDFDSRRLLLLGAPEWWPWEPYELTSFEEWESKLLQFTEDEILSALRALPLTSDEATALETLLEKCREVATPYVTTGAPWFQNGRGQTDTVEYHLNRVYRMIVPRLMGSVLPLVIVDEAHNWKHGPSGGANGFRGFAENIARRTRRALLLTATPFQINPDELIEILKVSDHLRPCPTEVESDTRRKKLAELRAEIIKPALDRAKKASRDFDKQWARLPDTVAASDLIEIWESRGIAKAREELDALLESSEVWSTREVQETIDSAVLEVDPKAQGVRTHWALAVCVQSASLSRPRPRHDSTSSGNLASHGFGRR